MSWKKMSRITRISYPVIFCCSNNYPCVIRNYGDKANRIIQWRKEEKKVFGPLLETSKQKLLREERNTNVDLSSQPEIINTQIKSSDKKGEILWALNTTNAHCIRRIKINQKSEGKENCVEVHENSKVISDENNSNSIESSNNEVLTNKNNELDNIIASVRNASLIHTGKSDVDKWESSTILSLSTINRKDFSFPGVTRILNESMSEKAKLMLENWKKRMILELGEEGFEAYQHETLSNSKIMHTIIENMLKKKEVDIPDHLKLTFKSINHILKDVENVRVIESHVTHPTLGYRGFIDCVATYKGNLCVIDWKKSDKLKTIDTLYDSPLQVSAYIGALNNDENYSFKVKTGLLTFAYADGLPASVFELSGEKLEFYWKEWLKRLEKYYTMRYS